MPYVRAAPSVRSSASKLASASVVTAIGHESRAVAQIEHLCAVVLWSVVRFARRRRPVAVPWPLWCARRTGLCTVVHSGPEKWLKTKSPSASGPGLPNTLRSLALPSQFRELISQGTQVFNRTVQRTLSFSCLNKISVIRADRQRAQVSHPKVCAHAQATQPLHERQRIVDGPIAPPLEVLPAPVGLPAKIEAVEICVRAQTTRASGILGQFRAGRRTAWERVATGARAYRSGTRSTARRLSWRARPHCRRCARRARAQVRHRCRP